MLKHLYKILFFLGLFFFPFNEFEGIPALGEYQNEAGAFFFLAGFVMLLFSGRIGLPFKNPVFWLLSLFLAWCFLTTLINLPTVLTSYFKHTSGVNRFIRQYFALILSSIIFFTLYWNVLKDMSVKDILLKIRKVFLFSLMVASVYGILETMVVIFHISAAMPLLKMFSYFPFLEVKLHDARISSVSYEPPFLAIYLITIAGWMFSYIITEKGLAKFIPMFLVLLLTYYSGSRTALLVIFIQIIVFFTFLYQSEKYRKYITYSVSFISVALLLLLTINAGKVIRSVETKLESLNFKDNLTKSISNKSRFGIQYASLQVFKEHPVVGVGFGQQSFHSRFHYPNWATTKNYEFKVWYKNQNERSFPPGYNIYTRLLAETGLIGTILFLSLLVIVIRQSRLYTRIKEGDEKTLAIILLISFVGFSINWMQVDTFRVYGFWVSLAILIRLNNIDFRTNE